ncbi:hypothetical protein SRABI76_01549 [Microbacterium oxydans]|uniref:hypothetical protein n=1 Tax=Microbacterium oxydans TaxID=82380 RepID=UPI001D6DEB11|nr:hypothetical protein [Microbacterium oxydans]CAH0181785.1 hypothetical protein SRABI76_01549 [Microbacterium oxydans]
MSEPTPDAQVHATVGRKLVRSPLVWGALLLAVAILATLAGDDLSFVPFLLMLVGGWCFGFAFVNATLRMTPSRAGVLLHAAVAILLGAAIAFVVELGNDMLAPFPERIRAIAAALQLAAIPAAGWIWLGLLSRVTDALTGLEAKKRPAPVTPEWEREENGDGSRVRFPGIPLRMRVLTGAIVVIVVVFGLGGTLLLIAFDDIVLRMGARVAIILVGIVIALPVYAVFTAVLRRHTKACTVAFGNDELRLSVGDHTDVIRFRDLEHLLWRTRSDYARIEVRGAGVDRTIIAGLAKPPAGRTAELPVLPRRVFRRLELAGMTLTRSRRADVVTFQRP